MSIDKRLDGRTMEADPTQAWKTADLSQWIRQDLEASISFLHLIRDNPELFNGIVQAVEKWRDKMVEHESKKAQA